MEIFLLCALKQKWKFLDLITLLTANRTDYIKCAVSSSELYINFSKMKEFMKLSGKSCVAPHQGKKN